LAAAVHREKHVQCDVAQPVIVKVCKKG
jgi:hypothetical protein